MIADDWIAAFAVELGVPVPEPTLVEQLLDLARTAAHQSERTAAPVAAYLVGNAGIDAARACEIAETVNPEAAS